MKRCEVIFSPDAKADLIALYDRISESVSSDVALSYIEPLEAYCLGFELASERGHRRDDIRPGLRIIGFERRLTVAFMVDENRVTILRLSYGGQDWEDAIY